MASTSGVEHSQKSGLNALPVSHRSVTDRTTDELFARLGELVGSGQVDLEDVMVKVRELLKPREVQELLRISKTTFWRLRTAGKIPGVVKVGGQVRILRGVLVDWLEKQSKTEEVQR